MRKHQTALAYATKAVDILTPSSESGQLDQQQKETVQPQKSNRQSEAGIESVASPSPAPKEQSACPPDGEGERKFATVGIAFYNMGAELEFLRYYNDAIEAYEKGIEKLRGNLPELHPVFQSLVRSCANAKERQTHRMTYHMDRSHARDLHSTKSIYAARPLLKESDISVTETIKREEGLSAATTPFGRTRVGLGLKFYPITATRKRRVRAASAKPKSLPYIADTVRPVVDNPYSTAITTAKGISEFINELVQKYPNLTLPDRVRTATRSSHGSGARSASASLPTFAVT